MNMLPILLKREFWEHRKTFFYLPLIILVLSAFFLIAVASSRYWQRINGSECSTQLIF